MNTFVLTASRCPKCGCHLDRATAFRHDASPKEGDLTVCAECLCLLQFGDGRVLVELGALEFALLPVAVRASLLESQAILRRVKAGES